MHLLGGSGAHSALARTDGVLGVFERHPGLRIVVVESAGEVGGKTDREMRLYITSLVSLAHQIGLMVRGHWMIENGLHWVLDVVFDEDQARNRKDNCPENLATLRKLALNVLNQARPDISIRRKRKRSGWSDEFARSVIGQMR